MPSFTLCVYASSSSRLSEEYLTCARETAAVVARLGGALVYGAGSTGLMGALADEALQRNVPVTGVVPRFMMGSPSVLETLADLRVTQTMRERKALMENLADAFLTLPGGFGTLEELLEIVTLRQLGQHEKPVLIFDSLGFFDPLLGQFERFYSERFAREALRESYTVVRSAGELETELTRLRDVLAERIE